MGGKCESIAILQVDSWRVKSIFKSNNGVSYEAISHTMHKLLNQPWLDSGISFERYATAMKYLGGVDTEVSLNDGITTLNGVSIFISSFMTGDPGEPYCMIPGECLKLLNKFIMFKREEGNQTENLLFLIDKEYYRTNLRLTTTKV